MYTIHSVKGVKRRRVLLVIYSNEKSYWSVMSSLYLVGPCCFHCMFCRCGFVSFVFFAATLVSRHVLSRGMQTKIYFSSLYERTSFTSRLLTLGLHPYQLLHHYGKAILVLCVVVLSWINKQVRKWFVSISRVKFSWTVNF